MIKAIIFDCFGVLYTDGKSRIIDACPSKDKDLLNDLFMQADYGFISGNEFTTQVADLLGINVSELLQMTEQLYNRNELLIDYVRQYKQQFKIGLLSNVSEQLFNDLFSVREQELFFDTVVLSSRVGLIKPSADIYRLALSQLGVDAHEAIMIDDVERNVQGARDVGMQGVRFTSTTQTIGELDVLIANGAPRA